MTPISKDKKPIQFSPASSRVQFKVPFMLGSAVYGSFGSFEVSTAWSNDQVLPNALTIHLDSTSINAQYVDKTLFDNTPWSGESKTKQLNLLLKSGNHLVNLRLKDHVCRFSKDSEFTKLALELEIDRSNWNGLRGLDPSVQALLNSGPVLLDLVLVWNHSSDRMTELDILAENQVSQIMQVQD